MELLTQHSIVFQVLFDESTHPRSSLPEKNRLVDDLRRAKDRLLCPPMTRRQDQAKLVFHEDFDLEIRPVCWCFDEGNGYLVSCQRTQNLCRAAADDMNPQLRPFSNKGWKQPRQNVDTDRMRSTDVQLDALLYS